MQGIGKMMMCVLLSTLCGACMSWWAQDRPQGKESKPKTLPPLHLGAIQQVYPSQKFALLRMIGPIPDPGTTLISHPADGSSSRIGNLMVSENSKPRNGMLVVDIRSGTVMSGDRVFLYRNVTPPEGTEALTSPPGENNAEATSKQPPLQIRTSGTTPLQSEAEPDNATTAPSTPEDIRAIRDASPSNGPAFLPSSPSTPPTTPDYLDDIPDHISEWN